MLPDYAFLLYCCLNDRNEPTCFMSHAAFNHAPVVLSECNKWSYRVCNTTHGQIRMLAYLKLVKLELLTNFDTHTLWQHKLAFTFIVGIETEASYHRIIKKCDLFMTKNFSVVTVSPHLKRFSDVISVSFVTQTHWMARDANWFARGSLFNEELN